MTCPAAPIVLVGFPMSPASPLSMMTKASVDPRLLRLAFLAAAVSPNAEQHCFTYHWCSRIRRPDFADSLLTRFACFPAIP